WIQCTVLAISSLQAISAKRIDTAVLTDILAIDETTPNPNEHLAIRLLKYFMFGGILQAISEQTHIPREKLVIGGPSLFQDKHSLAGSGLHAAHVIRVCAIDETLAMRHPNLTIALQNYIGHTQNVPPVFNRWGGIGGAIDLFQSSNLTELAKINFTRGYAGRNEQIVKVIVEIFRKIIEKYANGFKHSLFNLQEATIYCTDPARLFHKGREGYDMVKNKMFERHYFALAKPTSRAEIYNSTVCNDSIKKMKCPRFY
uniref:Uncharacterized protein n=1 Tax=Anopheles epiroticus TaxID=199890 RepID=A0A182PKI6_9DIPT